jgi:hypothetical protein
MPTREEWKNDVDVFCAEAHEGTRRSEARTAIQMIRFHARRLHAIYERQCNGHQTAAGDWDEAAANADDDREEKIEKRLHAIFAQHGLGMYLNTDPRGNPVGIMTPKTGRYNTMGGRECGWRL